jgi:hypothetical protein
MMEFMDEIPEKGVGVGIDVNTNQVFIRMDDLYYWMDEGKLDELIAVLIFLAEKQEVHNIVRWN